MDRSAITRLTAQWTDDYRTWRQRDLSQVNYVYVWADGIHVNVRLDEDKLCLLVSIGVRLTARKSWSRWPTATENRPGSWADLI